MTIKNLIQCEPINRVVGDPVLLSALRIWVLAGLARHSISGNGRMRWEHTGLDGLLLLTENLQMRPRLALVRLCSHRIKVHRLFAFFTPILFSTLQHTF